MYVTLSPTSQARGLPAGMEMPANWLVRGGGPLDAASASKPAIFCWLARTDLAAVARQPHFRNHGASSRQRRICHHHRRRPEGGGLHPDGLPVLRCVHLIYLFCICLDNFEVCVHLDLMSHSSPHLRDAHLPVVRRSMTFYHVDDSVAKGYPPSCPKHRASGQIDCGIRRQYSWHLSDVSVRRRRRRRR